MFPPPPQVPVQHDGMWRPSFRRAEAFSQGRASLVRSEAGPVYRVVRKLRDSLFGKVYQGQLCYVDGEGRVQPRPGAMVALKILSIVRTHARLGGEGPRRGDPRLTPHAALRQAHVRARRTMDGHRVDEDALQEMAFMQQLSNPGHPNLLRLFECLEDRRHYYMVMEFVDGGELYDVLNEQGRLNEAHAKHILRQLALGARCSPWREQLGDPLTASPSGSRARGVPGLAHLHARSVAHRDISLENAMVTSDGSVKVIDFGLAARVPRGEDGRHALFAPPFRSGKRTYQPPEVWVAPRRFSPRTVHRTSLTAGPRDSSAGH